MAVQIHEASGFVGARIHGCSRGAAAWIQPHCSSHTGRVRVVKNPTRLPERRLISRIYSVKKDDALGILSSRTVRLRIIN